MNIVDTTVNKPKQNFSLIGLMWSSILVLLVNILFNKFTSMLDVPSQSFIDMFLVDYLNFVKYFSNTIFGLLAFISFLLLAVDFLKVKISKN